jgi:hypothetical protein
MLPQRTLSPELTAQPVTSSHEQEASIARSQLKQLGQDAKRTQHAARSARERIALACYKRYVAQRKGISEVWTRTTASQSAAHGANTQSASKIMHVDHRSTQAQNLPPAPYIRTGRGSEIVSKQSLKLHDTLRTHEIPERERHIEANCVGDLTANADFSWTFLRRHIMFQFSDTLSRCPSITWRSGPCASRRMLSASCHPRPRDLHITLTDPTAFMYLADRNSPHRGRVTEHAN